MRIVAGKYKSRIIDAPEGLNTRPSSDKTRESIFNIIAPYIYDADVLDLFAGSGALGIEALSRGAKSVTFIDHDENAIKCIAKNLKSLNINNDFLLIKDDYSSIEKLKKKFDVVLMDPPYNLKVFDNIFKILMDNDLLNSNSIIVFESNEENHLKKEITGFTLKVKKYGIAYVNILIKN